MTLILGGNSFAQNSQDEDLELFEQQDAEVLKELDTKPGVELDLSSTEELDDLESLKSDIEEVYFDGEKTDENKVSKDFLKEIEFEVLEEDRPSKKASSLKEKLDELTTPESMTKDGAKDLMTADADKKTTKEVQQGEDVTISEFDVGVEESELLRVAENLGNKLTTDEWKEISKAAKTDSYTVQLNDTLWRISKKLFGTGFYYSKVWALNPYIRNPHEIEPGMILAFTEGDELNAPEIRMGDFDTALADTAQEVTSSGTVFNNLNEFGEDGVPNWLLEREKLKDQGIFVQNASEFTYDDLKNVSKQNLIKEYESYEPPETALNIKIPETYDELGFDKTSVIKSDFKQGFYLNTFLTSNIVQDFGFIEASPEENSSLTYFKKVYIRFDNGLSISPGDLFSIYSAEGEVSHPVSEREGFRYTIKGGVRIISKKNDLWEAEVFDVTGTIMRNDRITTYTPKIASLLKNFNQRSIEAAIIGSYETRKSIYGYGDVVYLDRGRADGLEIGNVLEVYSFTDRNTKEKITPDPTYKIGEITIITLTENFATAIVHNSSYDIQKANIAVTKTTVQAIRENKIVNKNALNKVNVIEEKALEELDVELNLDSIGEALLKKADQMELTEDELDELERQERERSFLKDYEEDLKELDRLEKEIEEAEGLLNEIIEDQDKLLEQEDLNKLEDQLSRPDPDAFESLDEIEQEIGKKYLDEDLNAKENPYGLTEFDLEEIDELLNTDEELNPSN